MSASERALKIGTSRRAADARREHILSARQWPGESNEPTSLIKGEADITEYFGTQIHELEGFGQLDLRSRPAQRANSDRLGDPRRVDGERVLADSAYPRNLHGPVVEIRPRRDAGRLKP